MYQVIIILTTRSLVLRLQSSGGWARRPSPGSVSGLEQEKSDSTPES